LRNASRSHRRKDLSLLTSEIFRAIGNPANRLTVPRMALILAQNEF
jgi:hypothetical protein